MRRRKMFSPSHLPGFWNFVKIIIKITKFSGIHQPLARR